MLGEAHIQNVGKITLCTSLVYFSIVLTGKKNTLGHALWVWVCLHT